MELSLTMGQAQFGRLFRIYKQCDGLQHIRIHTFQQELAQAGKQSPVVAVGDPSILDFEVVGPRQIRVVGQRIGVTDFTVITADQESVSFEVQVVADLRILRARLAAVFPSASLKLGQVSDHIVVEGQARDTLQVQQIMETIEAWLESVQAAQSRRITGQSLASQPVNAEAPGDVVTQPQQLRVSGSVAEAKIINLIRVPGAQQVMLKVQVAELNRTGMRRLGASFLFDDGSTALATNPTGAITGGGMMGLPFQAAPTAGTTVAGVISGANLSYLVDALRRNSVLKILAEPNLVAYHGHEATFLAGGEFPVPVPQTVGGVGGTAGTITVEFREFGVRLGFVPYILDEERIRLTVNPEVSSIDESLGIQIANFAVPGLNTRKSSTTVEMKQGQTLAMAGLLQVTLENSTSRIPGAGDLPVLGPFFSNNSGERVEKELVVMITPYLVDAMDPCEVGPLPGEEVLEPNDLEFYLLGRIESRVGRDFRSTTKWDNPLHCVEKMRLHNRHVCGLFGYSGDIVECPECRSGEVSYTHNP